MGVDYTPKTIVGARIDIDTADTVARDIYGMDLTNAFASYDCTSKLVRAGCCYSNDFDYYLGYILSDEVSIDEVNNAYGLARELCAKYNPGIEVKLHTTLDIW